ncbi:hypothetical protein ABC270_09555 [Curtobacterium sp. 1P10AnD]|uniref:hypothetical protein n=1 Tax=Curtobacterium sp. 1P10AnD TaxID=3132283 RepID=UPI0039A02583
MGNRVSCIVRSAATAGEGAVPAPAGDEPTTEVVGSWDVQYVLPFGWCGFVPATFWAAHVDRLATAMAAGAGPDPSDTDVVVAWSVAERAFTQRLPGVAAAIPEAAEPLGRFLEDVRSVADGTDRPVVELVLGELVEMYWDEEDLERWTADLRRETAIWESPGTALGDERTELTELGRAVASREPDRTFLLTGEWTLGGSATPSDRPPQL